MGDSPIIEEVTNHELKDKFDKARYIYYGERYYNSNKFVKGWYNVSTFFKLKSVELGLFFADRGHDVSRAGNNIKNSKFGEKVKKAGSVAKDGGKIVFSLGKRTGKGAVSFVEAGYDKTVSGAKAVANSYPAQWAEKHSKKGISKAGAWIKKKATSFANLFRKNKEKKEEMIELDEFDENGNKIKSAEELKKEEEEARKSKGKITLENQKEGHLKLAKDAIVDKAKSIGNDAKELAEKGKYVAGKYGGKAGKKVKGLASRFSEAVSDKYSSLKAKAIDHSYESSHDSALKKNQVKEMLRYDKAKVNDEYSDRMKKFREALKKDTVVSENLKLRGDLERLKRNAGPMEKGNIGDFELADMNSKGHFVKDGPGLGMLQNINRRDLGKAAIDEAVAEDTSKKEDKAKGGKQKVSLDDVKQENDDLKLIKEQGLDPKNLPKTAVKENSIVGKGAEMAKQVQNQAKNITEKANQLDNYRKKVKNVRDTFETEHNITKVVLPMLGAGEGYDNLSKKLEGYSAKVKGYNDKAEANIGFAKNVAKGVSSVAELGNGEEVTSKKVVTAVADAGVAVEGIVDKAGHKVPLSGISKTLYNAMNIEDGKERRKNISELVANGLQEAGAIMKYFGEENAFTNLSGLLNDKNVKFAEKVENTGKAFEGDDDVQKAIAVVNDISAGAEALKKVLDEYNIAKKNHTFLDQTKFLGPVVDILKAVEKGKEIDVVNDKIKGLTTEDKHLNFTDTNIMKMIDINADNIVRQNEDKKKGIMIDAGVKAAVDTIGIATGTNGITDVVGEVLSVVSPTQLIKYDMASKTDRELMFADAFGSKERQEAYKNKFYVTDNEIETELLRLSNTADAKQYANRVRAEAALHIHARELQAQEHGIENGATKLKGAAGLKGNTTKQVYREIGGSESFDRTVGRTKAEMHEAKKQEKAKNGPGKNH